MRLESFRVGPYRNFLDTGEVGVEEDVTVLLGKNESGKTNLLHALDTVRPARAPRALERHHYPRWLQKKHERTGDYQGARAVEVTFRLEDSDKEALAGKFGEHTVSADAVKAYRTYVDDSLLIDTVSYDEQEALRHALNELGVSLAPTLADLRERLTAEAADTTNADVANAALQRLKSVFGDHETVADAIEAFLRRRMPRFFYFDDHALLPGTADTAPLIKVLESGDDSGLNAEQRTALALLRMGFADDELISADYVARKSELQAVGADLTRSFFDYWTQNPHLRLSIDIDAVDDTDPQGNTRIVRRDLKLNVMDNRTQFEDSLDDRSSGFRWFLSFVAAFMEFQEDRNVIVLLDEPGLSLHGRAQGDFLRFIDEQVAVKHQVLFTTHSPFLVDPGHLDRVRVVEYAHPEVGGTVTTVDGATTADPDTLFPLQAALGYDVAQSLFIGAHNLVVEGYSDYWYLTVISEHLRVQGKDGLDERWRVLPAGGVSNVGTFVALAGPALPVTVLADGKEADSQKVQNLVQAQMLKEHRLVTPEVASTVKKADIEDVFTVDDYLTLYNAAFGMSLKDADLKGTDRIVKRIERTEGDFDHNKPARHLFHNPELCEDLSDETLANFSTLIAALNGTLG